MNKIISAASLALVLSGGAAFAASTTGPYKQTNVISRPPMTAARQRLVDLRFKHAMESGTTSAVWRDIGPSSSAVQYESPYGSANSGLPRNPKAPGAGNVTGGN